MLTWLVPVVGWGSPLVALAVLALWRGHGPSQTPRRLRGRAVPRLLGWAWLAAGGLAAGERWVQVQDARVLPYWMGLAALWQVGALAGGDAQFWLGAFSLWPAPALLGAMVGLTLGRGLLFAAWRNRGRVVRRQAR